jgi:hypothetical protein
LGAFGTPAPLLVVEVGAAPIHYVHGTATLIYEFAALSPAGLDCSFPHFGIGGPDCSVPVLVDVFGRVATHGGTILVSDPNPGFGVKATWALQTTQGFDIFSDGLNLPFTNTGGLIDEFSYTKSFSLTANRVYRIRMDVNAEAAASTLPASSFALIDPVFSFAPGVDPGYTFQFGDGIGNSRASAVPEPGSLVLLGASVVAFGLLRRRSDRQERTGPGSGTAPFRTQAADLSRVSQPDFRPHRPLDTNSA